MGIVLIMMTPISWWNDIDFVRACLLHQSSFANIAFAIVSRNNPNFVSVDHFRSSSSLRTFRVDKSFCRSIYCTMIQWSFIIHSQSLLFHKFSKFENSYRPLYVFQCFQFQFSCSYTSPPMGYISEFPNRSKFHSMYSSTIFN